MTKGTGTTGKHSGHNPGSTESAYEQIVVSVAEYLNQQGFSVKANAEGFPRPGKIKWEEEDEGVMPDLTGEQDGSLYVFEVETREIDANSVEDRWRLLSAHSKRHNGKFYLVVSEARAVHVERFVKHLSVKPELLRLRGID